ncbi:MAG TPA: alpha/beta hydrolase [Lacunisphaera sp.]|jgi:predicted esterase|nr:alpha/beta hydrolase [Lacunisphaera sp.]
MNPPTYAYRFEPGADPSAPPLLLLHGTGGDENDLVPLAQRLSPGSALLSPRGDVNEHGQLRFFRRFAEGVFDLADVARRAHVLADFVAAAAVRHGLDQSRLIALGLSNGANIATALLWLRPEVLSGAVLFRPMVVLEPDRRPDLRTKRVLISSGSADPIVPADHPARLARQFRAAGAAVDLQIHAASHGLVPGDLAAARKFFSPAAPPAS